MSCQRKSPTPTSKGDLQDVLDDILNFGPDPETDNDDLSERIKAIVKKLHDLNQRIDLLSRRS